MPDSEEFSSQMLEVWVAALASLLKALQSFWGKGPPDVFSKLRTARGPDEVLKILLDEIKQGDPKTVLIAISWLLKLPRGVWPQAAPIIDRLVIVLRVLVESFEKAASQEGI